MPCRDWEGFDGKYSDIEYNSLKADRDAAQKRCDLATRVACEIEKYLRDDDINSLSRETRNWIKKHREDDEKARKAKETQDRIEAAREVERKRVEALQLTALEKLTHEERRALGLPDPATK
jgi:hypothetical protein